MVGKTNRDITTPTISRNLHGAFRKCLQEFDMVGMCALIQSKNAGGSIRYVLDP